MENYFFSFSLSFTDRSINKKLCEKISKTSTVFRFARPTFQMKYSGDTDSNTPACLTTSRRPSTPCPTTSTRSSQTTLPGAVLKTGRRRSTRPLPAKPWSPGRRGRRSRSQWHLLSLKQTIKVFDIFVLISRSIFITFYRK